ncbi:MAG: DUF1571 domain-containing protein [Planctomycetes bacterium]|nr:DUF1571 domain-containing protein [Planctomycetota bacterium]
MKLGKILTPTNRNVRIIVGLLLGLLILVQLTQYRTAIGHPPQSPWIEMDGRQLVGVETDVFKKLENWAKTDHIALLDFCLSRCNYPSYTCTFVKQEVINGRTKEEQTMKVKFNEAPFSVAMEWVKNPPAGDRVIYIEGKYGGQMLVRPTNPLARKLCPTAKRYPNGPDAMQNTLRPVNLFGFKKCLISLKEVYEKARQAGDLKQEFGGLRKIGDRQTIALIRHLPPKDDYPAKKTVTYIDLVWLVPIMIEGTNWDDQFQCMYLYKDVNFNAAVADADFLPENNDMKPPR